MPPARPVPEILCGGRRVIPNKVPQGSLWSPSPDKEKARRFAPSKKQGLLEITILAGGLEKPVKFVRLPGGGEHPRMDAVLYCLEALKRFHTMPKAESERITFEIAALGARGESQ